MTSSEGGNSLLTGHPEAHQFEASYIQEIY